MDTASRGWSKIKVTVKVGHPFSERDSRLGILCPLPLGSQPCKCRGTLVSLWDSWVLGYPHWDIRSPHVGPVVSLENTTMPTGQLTLIKHSDVGLSTRHITLKNDELSLYVDQRKEGQTDSEIMPLVSLHDWLKHAGGLQSQGLYVTRWW